MRGVLVNRLNVDGRGKNWRRAMVVGLAVGGMFCAVAGVVRGEAVGVTQYWLGGTGNWTNAALWSPAPGSPWPDAVLEGMYPNNTAEYSFVANLYGGGTATIQAGEAIVVSTFYLGQNTTLDGAGSLEVLGDFQWVGGNMLGSGAVVVRGDVDLTFAQQNARSVYRPVTTEGTVNYTGGYVYLNNSGDWNSYGTFNLGGPNGISKSVGNAVFHNRGVFNKTGTSNVAMAVGVVNHGAMNVREGKLTFNGGLTNEGTVDVSTGATLAFNAGSTHAAGSRIIGAGAVDFAWGTHNLASYEATGPVTFGAGATVTFNNTINPSSLGDLVGTVNFNAPQVFPSVRLMGVAIGGAGNLDVTSSLFWQNGSMVGTGTTTIALGAVAELVGNNSVLGVQRAVVNNGTVNHNGTGLAINSGAVFTNNGTFNAIKGGMSRSSGSATFDNVGTLRKTSTSTYTIGDNIAFNNTGSLFVDEGTLELAAKFSNTGSVVFAPGTKLRLTANTFTGAAGSSVSGDVPVQVTGGAHTFADAGAFGLTGALAVSAGNLTLNGAYSPVGDVALTGGTLTLNGATVLNNLTLSSALSGAGVVTVKGTTTWGSASVNTGGGLVFDVGSVMNMPGMPSDARSVNRNVESRGVTTWSGGSLSISGATWLNTGEFTAANTSRMGRIGAGGTFRNDGTFTKTGTSTLQFEPLLALDNRGTFEISGGHVQVTGGGENRGVINVPLGSSWQFNGSTFTGRAGSTLTGGGTFAFTGSATHTFEAGAFTPTGTVTWAYGTTVNINNAINPAVLGPIEGVVNFNADQVFSAVTLTGTIGGTGTVRVTDAFNFGAAGTVKGNVEVGSGVTMEILTNGTRTVTGTLRADGVTRLAAGQLTVSGPGKFINGGTLELSGGQLNSSGAGASLENAGTVVKVGTGSMTIPASLLVRNNGIVDVKAGTLGLGAVHADQVGTTFGGPGTWIVRAGATLATAGGNSIKTNASTIMLEGVGSVWQQVNPLENNQGWFEIRGGRNFVTAGALVNSGRIGVGEGSTLKVVGALTNTGQVDVDGGLVVDYSGAVSAAEGVREQLKVEGIFSGDAFADPLGRRGLGYVEASQWLGLSGAQTATWGGVVVDATSVLVMPAWRGDANLDGVINADDFALVDRGMARGGSGWVIGDFDYSGAVDAADYLIIDRVYQQLNGVTRLSPALLAEREVRFGAGYVEQLVASVPEPTGLLVVGGVLVVGGRRRRA